MRSSLISQDLPAPAPEIASAVKTEKRGRISGEFYRQVLALSDAFRLTNSLSALLYIISEYLTSDKWRTVDLIQHSFS